VRKTRGKETVTGPPANKRLAEGKSKREAPVRCPNSTSPVRCICRTSGPVEHGKRWLEKVLELAVNDGYLWRAALAHLHLGDWWQARMRPSSQHKMLTHYNKARELAEEGSFAVIQSAAQRRLIRIIQES
jgi:hypothetical protein